MNSRWLFARRALLAPLLVVTLLVNVFTTSAAPQKTECNVRVTLLQVNDVYQFSPDSEG